MSRYTIIDADSLTYSVPFGCQCKDTGDPTVSDKQFRARMTRAINRIIKATDASEYQVHLTGNDYLRKDLTPTYKANRVRLGRPFFYEAAREFLIDKHGAIVSEGTEADDDVCIEYNKAVSEAGDIPYEPVLCHIDKDIDQLPGLHYNPNKNLFYKVSEVEGRENLYSQTLEGDRADNIQGIARIGYKKARQWLEGYLDSDLTAYQRCLEKYVEVYGDTEGTERLNLNMQLLYLHRCEGDQWRVPSE